jgi:hypothetical protein
MIKHITLSFGRYAMVHTARWYSPDEVFELFDPEMYLDPPGKQCFWRCQIRDLMSELRLSVLTINLTHVPKEHVAFVTRALLSNFGRIDNVRFLSDANVVNMNDAHIEELQQDWSWAQLCHDVFESSHGLLLHNRAFGKDRKAASIDQLDQDMSQSHNRAFFEQTWSIGDRM